MILATLLAVAAAPQTETFQVGNLTRQALVYRPEKTANAPLLFVFHGHGGGMNQAARSYRFHEVWPEAVVVYPDGLPTKGKTDPEGLKKGWQQRNGDYEDRDLAFFDKMLATFKQRDHVDAKKVFVTGHSNGGRMTYLLWAERGEKLTSVAPSASPATLTLMRARKLPAFITAGESDPIVSYQSQARSIQGARTLLGVDSSKAKKTGYVTIEPGSNGIDLGTYIFPGGHQFPSPAIQEVVKFFKEHGGR